MLGGAGKRGGRGRRPRADGRLRSAVDAIKRLMRRRLAVLLIALLGAALVSPSLSSGLQTEDFEHSLIAQSSPWYANIFGTSDVARLAHAASTTGGVQEISNLRQRAIYAAKDSGTMPWITSPDWRVDFWRPLASWTHHFDYTVLAEHPWAMHAHSVAWYFLLILIVGFLFRRITTSLVVASVAALLYAIDESHGLAVGWLANRNAVMATVFGVAALLVHDAWRRKTESAPPAWRWMLPPLSGILLYCAMASAEFGIGAFAYVVAHTLTLDRGRWRTRAVALVPALAAGLVWAIPYRLAGYGAVGSGMYVDPLAHPAEFLRVAVSRFPSIVSGSLSGLPPEILDYFKASNAWVGLLEWGIIVVAALVLAPLFRDARIRFWAAGFLLSALPLCAAGPAARSLFFTTLGAFALLAELLGALARTPRGVFVQRRWRAPAIAFAVLVFVPNALFAVGLQPLSSVALQGMNDASLVASDELFDAHGPPEQYLWIVNAPAYYSVGVLFGLRRSQGKTIPDHVRVMHAGMAPITVGRPAKNILTIHAPDGFVSMPVDEVYRGRHVPFKAGELLPLSGVLIRIDEVDEDGVATKATFRFGRALSDELYRFVAWSGMKVRPFTLPPVGDHLELPGVGAELEAASDDPETKPEAERP